MNNPFRSFLGHATDSIGTALHLPEFGLSEALNGGATQNTNDQPLYGTNAMFDYGQNKFLQQAPIKPTWGGDQIGKPSSQVGNNTAGTFANFGQNKTMGSPVSAASAISARVVPPAYRFFGGNQFNIDNPSEAQGYFKAKSDAADSMQQNQTGLLNTKYSQSLNDAASANKLYGQQIDQSMNNIGNDETNYAAGFNNRVDQFGRNYRSGSANRQNSFAALSPGVLQSAQGDEQGYADTMYGKGLNDLNRENGQQQQSFADSKSNLGLEKSNLMDTYNNFRTNSQNSLNQETADVNNYANNIRNSTAAEVAPYQARAGVSNFADEFKNSGGLKTYDPSSIPNVDMGKYNAATSFAGLGGQTTGAGAAGAGGNPFSNMAPAQTNPFGAYLAQNAGNINADPMKQYLYGAKQNAN